MSSEMIDSVERRKVLASAGLVATMAAINPTLAFGSSQHEHEKTTTNVVDTALDCVKKGQACIEHCLELFKIGDTSVAECANTVQEMLAICTAISQMASYRSKYLPDLAKVCINVCEDCENECRKHEKMHAACKACANSCEECIKECKKLIA